MKQSVRLASILFVFCFLSLAANAATYTVTNESNTGGGSLRQAVASANATAEDDTIVFAANMNCANNQCKIVLSDELVIGSPSSGRLRIDNQTAQTITIYGTVYRIFYVNGFLEINRLTLLDGQGRTLFDPASDRRGGAVFVENGEFTMTNSVIQNSRAEGNVNCRGGGIYVNGGSVSITDSEIVGNRSIKGGAIYQNGGTLTLNRVLIADNIARSFVTGQANINGDGGGIALAGGTFYAVNTTFYRNSAEMVSSVQATGGAVFVEGNATPAIQLTNSTLVYNSASDFHGGIYAQSANIRLRNTVAFGNTASSNNFDLITNFNFNTQGYTPYTSGGGNVFGNLPNGLALQSNDRKDATAAQVGISQTLGNYGGATRTLPVAANSILVNAGNNCVRSFCSDYGEPFAFSVDQRGVSRFDNGSVDIGAIERNIVQFASAAQLPAGRQNQSYFYNFTAQGGIAPYSYAVAGGELPPGLQLAADGTLSGTPTATGTYNFAVRVTDSSLDPSFARFSDYLTRSDYFDSLAPEAVSNTQNFQLQILAQPTAASVSIGGRVLQANGRAISGAIVTLIDAGGNTRFARTNSFGYYRFDEVAAGATYIFQARHKRFDFAAQVLSVSEEMNNINFTAVQ